MYKVFSKHKDIFLGQGINIKMINSEILNSIPACNIVKPILNNQFTFSFWIYIKDFYYNSNCKSNCNCFKHIFHKGTLIEQNPPLTYDNWTNLISEISEQSIGLWMLPNINNLRVAINVESELHPNIEYCDIENIPSKELVHITILMNKNHIEIYLNGKLYKTQQLTNNIIFNSKDMYFNYQHTYSGKLFNFLYLPKLISFNEIQNLFKNKPNLNTK